MIFSSKGTDVGVEKVPRTERQHTQMLEGTDMQDLGATPHFLTIKTEHMPLLTDNPESNFGRIQESDLRQSEPPPFGPFDILEIFNYIPPMQEEICGDKYNSKEGFKEHENKTDYSEIDFSFLTQIARRMNKNKGKYPKNNWKKPIDVEKLKQAMFRHTIAVMQGEYKDDGRDLGHLEAIALGAMMINYQLKYLKK